MKTGIIASILLATCFAASAPAFAQPYGHGGNPHRNEDRHPDYRQSHHHDYRGAGPRHNLYRGARIPQEYRNRHYVVTNWRAHRLAPPPRGTHWVQTGADYVLVRINSGIIAQVVLSN